MTRIEACALGGIAAFLLGGLVYASAELTAPHSTAMEVLRGGGVFLSVLGFLYLTVALTWGVADYRSGRKRAASE